MRPAPPPASVIVASQGRPAGLVRLLRALRHQDHPLFEVIAVTDAAGRAALEDAGLLALVKHVPFEAANLSAARNRGLALAAAEVVAFIDDDAVAEPTWLRHLAQVFERPDVGAAGGFVRGRNGFSFQWRARAADRCARHEPLDVTGRAPVALPGDGRRAVRTEGTNCAFRRAALQAIGGFDEAIRFYLDDTDVNLRLGRAGWATAIVPLAQVQHGFAASARRRADRVPHDLREMGASLGYFLCRHAPAGQHAAALAGFRAEQRARLVRHMIAGRIEPGAVARLLRGLEAGLAEGAGRAGPLHAPPAPPAPPLRRFPATGAGRRGLLLAARPLFWRRARAEAAARAAEGEIVTLLALSFTPRPHVCRFTPEGYWLVRGGVYGRASREAPPLCCATLMQRAAEEARRLSGIRPAGRLRRIGLAILGRRAKRP